MKSSRDIKNLFKNLHDITSAEMDERVLRDVSQAMEQTLNAQAEKPSVRRIIMQSKMTKFVAATVIIIAVMMGINSFLGTGASVAWADVVEKVEQIEEFAYRTTQTGENEQTNYESMTYVSGPIRRIDVYQSGKIVMTNYVLPAERAMIVIMPAGKKYQRVQLKKEDLDELNRKADPRELVQRFMSSDHKKLGRKTINGILAEGIEVTDTTLADGDPLKMLLGKLWVDIETNLPVLLEAEVLFENGPQQTIIVDKLQWNIALDDSEFVPNIPDDFTDINEKEKSKDNEQKAIPKKTMARKKELTNEDKNTEAIIKEMTLTIFQACANEDWERFFKFMYYELTETRVKDYEFLGGLKIVSINKPFQLEGSSKWVIPYKVTLRNGELREENLYIAYFKNKGRYAVTGGLKE